MIPLELPVRDNALFSSGFGSALTFPQLEIGDEVKIDTFDPMTLRAGTARVRCIAKQQLEVAGESLSTRVLKVSAGGLETRAWVDDHGEVDPFTEKWCQGVLEPLLDDVVVCSIDLLDAEAERVALEEVQLDRLAQAL